MDDVDLAADPWVSVSWSDDGVRLLCQRPECMWTDELGHSWWWYDDMLPPITSYAEMERATGGGPMTPERITAAANAHRRTHLPEATP